MGSVRGHEQVNDLPHTKAFMTDLDTEDVSRVVWARSLSGCECNAVTLESPFEIGLNVVTPE